MLGRHLIQNPEFVQEVIWKKFYEIKSHNYAICQMVSYLGMELKHDKYKQVIKKLLIDCLVDDDLLDEFYVENKIEVDDDFETNGNLEGTENS